MSECGAAQAAEHKWRWVGFRARSERRLISAEMQRPAYILSPSVQQSKKYYEHIFRTDVRQAGGKVDNVATYEMPQRGSVAVQLR